MAGPPITVDCACGERLRLAYGEVATCACGRRYDAGEIPAADYAAVARTVRRYRLGGYALAAVLAALVLVGAVTRPAVLVLWVPFALLLWFTLLRPLLRRRFRAAIARFPSWQLEPRPRR